jgi:hypothetical protein
LPGDGRWDRPGFQSLTILSLAQVPQAKLGVGSGVFNTFRLIGGVLGVAILVSVLTGQLHTNLEQTYRTAGALAHAAVIDAFRTTWLLAALCAGIGFVSALLIYVRHHTGLPGSGNLAEGRTDLVPRVGNMNTSLVLVGMNVRPLAQSAVATGFDKV